MNRFICITLLFLISLPVAALDLEARLSWVSQQEMGTLVSGMVSQVDVQPGQKVKKGEVLVRLDDREFRARLNSARASYAKAQALFEEAKREEERSQELYDRTLLSDHELQMAQIDRIKAESLLEQTKSDKLLAEIDLERTVIKAPFDAMVESVLVAPGQVVLNKLQIQPMVILVSSSEMGARASLKGKQLGGLAPGKKVSVAVAGDWMEGEISSIEAVAGPAMEGEQAYMLTVVFSVQDNSYRAGEPAVIRVDE